MSTKIIKAWINGEIREIEVEDIVSPEQPLSYDERLESLEESDVSTDSRLDILEDKPIVTAGNLLVGNGTTELEEMTPDQVLSHINGASVTTMTTAEFEVLDDSEVNANTLYMLTDAEEPEYALRSDLESLQTSLDGKANSTHYHNYFPYRTKLDATTLSELGAKNGGVYYMGSATLEDVGSWIDIVKTGASGGDGYALTGGASSPLYYIGYNSGSACTPKRVLTHILTSNDYGTSLPAAGTAGRVFFKKV